VAGKRERETTEYAGMVRRIIRAHGRRVADADEVDLAELVAIRETLDEAIATAVLGQRERHGASWADVARGLGVTRQYAQRTYGKVAS
jgi:aromatic ring hydroxylase